MKQICLWSFLLLLKCYTTDGRGVDIGMCDKWIYDCRCGTQPKSYMFQLKFDQCTYFYRWKPKCRPCDGQEPEQKCAPYSQCLECRDQDGCVSCPEGKFGHWCNGDCKCENGGSCNRGDGSCSCPPFYKGTFCETLFQCPAPEVVAGLTWDGNSTLVGDVIFAKCKPGSALIGTKTRTCSANGTWLPESPICEPTCFFPTLGPHVKAKINPEAVNKTFDSDGKEIIREIELTCDPGYTLVGPHRLQCQSNGEWDLKPPTCKVLKVCNDPGTPSKGNRVVVDAIDGAFVPGTAIKFTCSHGHFLSGSDIITCVSSGNWSAALPSCPPVTGCPPPDVPDNGKVEVTKPVIVARITRMRVRSRMGKPMLKNTSLVEDPTPNIPPGYSSADSKALYSCNSVYYRLNGAQTRICLPNGAWSGKQPVCQTICGQSYEAKRPSIINGTNSVQGKWPWQAALFYATAVNGNETEWSLRCGGSLVNENWLITAAHCVSEKKITKLLRSSEFKIYLGKYHVNPSLDDSEVKVFGAKRILVHPNYHPRSMDSDIALIELDRSVTFTKRIQPICLPEEDLSPLSPLNDNLPDVKTGMATGWGVMDNGQPADILQETELEIVNRSFCEQEYRSQGLAISVTTNMFCAGWEQGGTGTCRGDSGGPFVVQEPDSSAQLKKKWVLRGIISWGGSSQCAVAHQFGGLLNVANFVPWVEQFI